MADINALLSGLEKVRPNGQGKWMACCPAHEDRSPSLGIKITDDDRILIHCFAGCEVGAIVSAIGLTLADLMPDIPKDQLYKKGSRPPKFNKFELFDKILNESRILSIAMRQILEGKSLDNDDLRRVIQAENTINDLAMEILR
ncbi:hypothetical protein AU255_04965 [Methyloprofundus sedimenti]|uniref:Uncharacterized protein n=1 Tax=Methyloprofundus sedimenti TaxID=1420851 RepID=A0A1V8M6S4_9GAMM|nr:hypothetical protein [Methyloprofundus sedimenti]OQK17245.1 hypothetical protein AU255_04965 [Methyloprofundus sedimenti]